MAAPGKVKLIARNGLISDPASNVRYAELAKVSNNIEAQARYVDELQSKLAPFPERDGSLTLAQFQAEQERYNRNVNRLSDYRQQIAQSAMTVGTRRDNALRGDYEVVFEVSPEITESGSASYVDISDIRGPASILYYQGSASRNFSISAKFVSRTTAEATQTARNLHILKSWRVPESTTGGVGLSPPTLLYLQGYGSLLKNIPVVMTDLSIELPSEHDYVEDGVTAVPIITSVSISLREAHGLADSDGEDTLSQLGRFNIIDYRLGRLEGW